MTIVKSVLESFIKTLMTFGQKSLKPYVFTKSMPGHSLDTQKQENPID